MHSPSPSQSLQPSFPPVAPGDSWNASIIIINNNNILVDHGGTPGGMVALYVLLAIGGVVGLAALFWKLKVHRPAETTPMLTVRPSEAVSGAMLEADMKQELSRATHESEQGELHIRIEKVGSQIDSLSDHRLSRASGSYGSIGHSCSGRSSCGDVGGKVKRATPRRSSMPPLMSGKTADCCNSTDPFVAGFDTATCEQQAGSAEGSTLESRRHIRASRASRASVINADSRLSNRRESAATAAATKVQALLRGRQARLKPLRVNDRRESAVTVAATKVQALLRGRQARVDPLRPRCSHSSGAHHSTIEAGESKSDALGKALSRQVSKDGTARRTAQVREAHDTSRRTGENEHTRL